VVVRELEYSCDLPIVQLWPSQPRKESLLDKFKVGPDPYDIFWGVVTLLLINYYSVNSSVGIKDSLAKWLEMTFEVNANKLNIYVRNIAERDIV